MKITKKQRLMYSDLIDNIFIEDAGEDYRLIKIRNEHDKHQIIK